MFLWPIKNGSLDGFLANKKVLLQALFFAPFKMIKMIKMKKRTKVKMVLEDEMNSELQEFDDMTNWRTSSRRAAAILAILSGSCGGFFELSKASFSRLITSS